MIPLNPFVIRTVFFIFSVILEVQLFKHAHSRYSWLGRVLRLVGLIITVTLLMIGDPTIHTFDDFFSVLLGPAVVSVTLAIGFGHLWDWCNQKKANELEKQYPPLLRSYDNDNS